MVQRVEDLLGVGLDSQLGAGLDSLQEVELDNRLGVGLGSLLGAELLEDLADRQVEDTVCENVCMHV